MEEVDPQRRASLRNKRRAKQQAEITSNVIGQATILMVAGILVRIIGVLYRSPLTSIIGDEGNGYYGIAYNIYQMILLVASYSIPMAVSKVISGKLALKQYRDAYRVFLCALIYVLVIGGIAALFTFFGAPILIPRSQANAIPVLRILAPTIFFSGFLGVFRGYFQAHGTMVQTSISQIIEQVANAVFSVGMAVIFIFLFAGGDSGRIPVFGAMGSAVGTGAGVLAGLLFMLFVYRGNRRYFKKHIKQDVSGAESSYGEIFKVIILMVTPVILSTFVYNISATLDQTLFCDIMDFKGMEAASATTLYGVFSGKYMVLINVPVALANSMSTAMIPSVSSTYTLGDMKGCNRHVKQAIHFTMMIAIPAAAGLCAMARPVMEVLFPQRATIDLAVALLRFGCISVVFYCLSTISNGILQGIGKVNIPLRNAAVALVLHLIVLTPLLFFTNLQLYAMVIATMAYSLMMCIFNSISVKRYLGYSQEIRKTFVIPAVAALIMGILGYVFYQGIIFILGSLLYSFLPIRLVVLTAMLIAVIFSVAVYFVVELKLGGVGEEELLGFPKGASLIRLARRFNLL
ncbi:MAG: polysaccharide biosynthesis protein [Eubacterium sp.]|nr:polysaccharide biosynthesis protein [Eubacterium sp.]